MKKKVRQERILILAKTYPSPSTKYSETTCVAGITSDGEMRRLYPVPFRMIEKNQQFKKWQWIETLVEKAPADHRNESHRLYVDTVACKETIEPRREWIDRLPWIDKIPTYSSPDELDHYREQYGLTLGLLRPKQLIELQISHADKPQWTKEEEAVLIQYEMQGKLFSEDEEQARRQIKKLRKVPFDFHYRYICDTPEGEKEYKHKIVDWETGALFWNCKRSHGSSWEKPFRAKYGEQIPGKDLMFLMGNQHRFQHQWLIISVLYPPKRKIASSAEQGSLF